MGGRLALAGADVVARDTEGAEAPECSNCGIQVIGALLRVTKDGTVRVNEEGVANVVRVSQKVWRVEMADGSSWTATRKRGCSTCGGR